MKSQIFMGMALACAMLVAHPVYAHDMDDMHHRMGEGCCDKSLPPDKARMVEGMMHQGMERDRPLFERMHKLHEKMMALGEADKFDRKAFTATADEMAALHMKIERNRTNTMVSIAEKLTGAERRSMAKCMEKDFHHEGMRHGEEREGGMNSHNDYGALNK